MRDAKEDKLPNKIQSGEYSMDGGVDGISYNMVWQDSDGNRNVPYLNWNGNRWYLNWNWLDNDWNGNDRLVSLRNWPFSPLFGGVFLLLDFASRRVFFQFHLMAWKARHIFWYQVF